jgi:hypothetical protein
VATKKSTYPVAAIFIFLFNIMMHSSMNIPCEKAIVIFNKEIDELVCVVACFGRESDSSIALDRTEPVSASACLLLASKAKHGRRLPEICSRRRQWWRRTTSRRGRRRRRGGSGTAPCRYKFTSTTLTSPHSLHPLPSWYPPQNLSCP